MINGGYKIISLSSPTVHDDIENNYSKAIMLTDIIIDGVEKPDIFVSEYSVVSGNFVFYVYDKTVTVTADNEVTYKDGGKHLYVVMLEDDTDNRLSFLTTCYVNNFQITHFGEDETEDEKNLLKNLLKNAQSQCLTGGVNATDTNIELYGNITNHNMILNFNGNILSINSDGEAMIETGDFSFLGVKLYKLF